MTRAFSLALPLLTALVVAYALLVGAVPRKVHGARVYGGPTENVGELSLRVEVVERDGEKETPYWNTGLVARVDQGGRVSEIRVTRALQGVADFQVPIDPATGVPLELELQDTAGALLASGPLRLDDATWAARARRRGGWIRGRESGGLQVSVAAERGAFVVGADEQVRIRVQRAGAPAPGLRLAVTAQGARVQAAADPITDEQGQARVLVEPTELNPTLRVEVVGESAIIDTGLPVVPGGLHVAVEGASVRVESAVPRTLAFYSWVTSERRIAGGVLALSPTDRGGAIGTIALPALPSPAWLVVSSEVDANSAAAIGWPIAEGESAEPLRTFDVAEARLLDGLPGAFQREQARRSRVRWLCAGLIVLALVVSALLLVVRVRAAEREIATHLREALDPELAARVAPRRSLSLLVALLTIALGFLAFALIVAAR